MIIPHYYFSYKKLTMGDLTNLTMPRDALLLRKSGSYVIKVNADSTVSHLADVVGKSNKRTRCNNFSGLYK